MKPVDDRVQIFLDQTGDVFAWVVKNLQTSAEYFCGQITLGIMQNNEVIAGVVLSNIRENVDVWMTIFALDKKWCNRRILRALFGVCFDVLKCRRASVRVDASNQKSVKLIEGLGFHKEGVLRAFEDNGNDAIIYAMFNNECLWR
ncbi:MAG: GNAT family N-acetyltransferase [Alphaproteobacteria bacterium]|nr:GNAT family N-acetyltransferase [Alphaproteobacteria bacterium]